MMKTVVFLLLAGIAMAALAGETLSVAQADSAAYCPPAKYAVGDLVELKTGARLYVKTVSKYNAKTRYDYGLSIIKGGDVITTQPEDAIKGKV